MNKVYISMEFQATNQKLPRFWNFKRPIRNFRDFRISSDQSETPDFGISSEQSETPDFRIPQWESYF